MKKGRRTALNNKRGFTFIELLIVCAIMLVLIAFSTPNFRKAITDLELKESAADITKFIAYAQQEAIIDGTVYKLTFDFQNKRYRLFQYDSVADNKGFRAVTGRFGRIYHLPRSVRIEGEKNDMLLYPDGHGDKIELRLISKDDKVMVLTSTGVLGGVDVTRE